MVSARCSPIHCLSPEIPSYSLPCQCRPFVAEDSVPLSSALRHLPGQPLPVKAVFSDMAHALHITSSPQLTEPESHSIPFPGHLSPIMYLAFLPSLSHHCLSSDIHFFSLGRLNIFLTFCHHSNFVFICHFLQGNLSQSTQL